MKNVILMIFIIIGLFSINQAYAKDVDVVGRITPPNPDISGIAVSKNSRIFISFPQNTDSNKMLSFAEYKEGKLISLFDKKLFSDKKNNFGRKTISQDRLLSMDGVTLDELDRLWVVENAKSVTSGTQSAVKLLCFDINTNKIIENIEINEAVLNKDSKLMNVRVDLTHGRKGTAYITNASIGNTPSIIVVDIANLKAREVLINHYSTKAKEGFMSFVENKPIVYDSTNIKLPSGGVNGIAFVKRFNKIYWTTLSGRELYSISADVISDFTKSDRDIQNSVKYEGERPACDGFTEDNEGNLYFGAYEQQSIVKRTPEGNYINLAKDETLSWASGLAYSNGFIYATLGQWNRIPKYNNGKDFRIPPFLIIKVMADK